MHRIAFATYRAEPGIDSDDLAVATALQRAGVVVSPAVWDEPSIDWETFDAVVIRSTWDYHLRPAEYEKWVRRFTAPGPKLWNSPLVILANLHKSYLMHLPGAVPTECLPAGSTCELQTILDQRGWDDAVVKPAISAGAIGTWRAFRRNTDERRFAEQVGCMDVLIQPYLAEVESVGEWSLVFFEKVYSHAVLKRPTRGDFRVQEHLGGSSRPAQPSSEIVEQARCVLATVDSPLLYARVDGVERDGRLLVTELELTEPSLYLTLDNAAAVRFAESILRTLK